MYSQRSNIQKGNLLTESAAKSINAAINSSVSSVGVNQVSERFGETCIVLITSVDAIGKYSATIVSGSVNQTDNTADLDLSGMTEVEEGDTVYLWNLAEDVNGLETANVFTTGMYVPAMFVGVSDDGVSIVMTYAGGGGGVDPPTEQGQVLQATGANTYGWQFPILHSA